MESANVQVLRRLMGVAFVFTLRDSRVTKVEEFFDRNEALQAAGLDQASTK
jgi:ketosteroid isomerase-like protein